jgi:predicted NBD/HSP70 family sugar kinase
MVKVESQPSVGSTNRGANRDDLRQSNLSNLLKLVYRNQTISRADLTTMTGLNRSTISDLVGELVSLKLVTEKESAQVGRVGRPSSNVTIAENIFAITVVPRSHSTLVAAVSMSGRVAARVRIATVIQPSPEEVLDAVEEGLAQIRKQLKKSDRIVGVSVAISGQVDVRNNSIRICSFLKWNEVPFGSLLSERLGLPVQIDNDGSIACLAESTFGSGRGFSDIIYLFGGTGGIGGGLVIDDKLVRGYRGYAGELGHIRITDSKSVDSLGLTGTLEALVNRDQLSEALGLDDPEDEELADAILAATSPRARRIIEKKIDVLAVALANLVNIFNPQVILLSGFLQPLFQANDYSLLSKMRQGAVAGSREHVQIRTAELGSKILDIGGAQLVFQELLNNPAGN